VGKLIPTVLIIGEAPGQDLEGEGPLVGLDGARLRALAGVKDLREHARLTNLLGFSHEGSFPIQAASIIARYVKTADINILLGRRVGAAFNMGEADYFEFYEGEGAQDMYAVFPKPTGEQQWWKNAKNVREARDFLRGVLFDEGS